MIIGLFGKKGAGKDYYAKNFLLNQLKGNTLIVSFADSLKLFALEQKLFTFDELYVNKSKKSREWMQWYGTDIKRNQDPDYWINNLKNTIKINQLRGIDNFIITDVRFLNEIKWIKSEGGLIYKIVDPDYCIQDNHISENELNDFDAYDLLIINKKGFFNKINVMKHRQKQLTDKRAYDRLLYVNRLLKYIKLENYLDIGTGNGQIASVITDDYNIKNTYGIDLYDPENYQGPTNVKYQKSKIPLPFKDNMFDLITCFQSLHHLDDIEKMLTEIVRVLKPNGYIFIREHNAYNNYIKKVLYDDHAKWDDFDPKNDKLNFMSKDYLIQLLNKYGFELKEYIFIALNNSKKIKEQKIYHMLLQLKK